MRCYSYEWPTRGLGITIICFVLTAVQSDCNVQVIIVYIKNAGFIVIYMYMYNVL